MKQKTYLTLILIVISLSFSSAQIIELTFTGESGASHVPLSSVIIENITQGGDTVLNYPDTVITLGTVGIVDGSDLNSFSVQQNYPNPFDAQTNIDIFLPEAGNIEIVVHNVIGKELISYGKNLNRGPHSFSFTPGNGEVYFLTARYTTGVKSIRMVAVSSNNNQKCELNYIGSNSNIVTYKSTKGFQFTIGDQLKLIGNSLAGSDTIVDAPTTNYNYVFQYNSSAACQGDTAVVYGGQTYTTVGIGTQCWMKENLNIGVQINNGVDQTNNSIIEKYCYNDNATLCDFLGGLYQWDEMMNYGSSSVKQGICPWGWHVPTDDEWTTLVDYLGGASIAGGKLKDSTFTHWTYPNTGATNSSGFTALPGGYHDIGMHSFYTVGENGVFLSSTEIASDTAWSRFMLYTSAQITRFDVFKSNSYSVRCMKDTCSPMPTQASAGFNTMDIMDDSIALMANTPVFGQGQWSIMSGSGGYFVDTTDPGTVFYGLQDSAYVLIWTISNNCGSTTDTVIIGFGSAFYCGLPFTDARDTNTYNTVLIGSQCWMAENLAYLPSVTQPTISSIFDPHFYVYYYNGTDVSAAKASPFYSLYGVLYNWIASMDGDTSSNSVPSGVQGICPDGWHLPSDAEWIILEGTADSKYPPADPIWQGTGLRGLDAGKNLKSATSEWNLDPANAGIDKFGFTALPAGRLSPFNPGFVSEGSGGFFRTSREKGFVSVYIHNFYYSSIQSRRDDTFDKTEGASVRCVKD